VEQARLAAGLGLASQVADVHLQRVRGGLEVEAPDLVEQDRPGQHLLRVAQEQLQQSEFHAGEGDPAVAAAHLAGGRVQ